MSVERPLLMRVERFLRRTGMPASSLGRAAAKDPRLVSDMRGGRMVGRRLEQRIEHFMNKYEGNRA